MDEYEDLFRKLPNWLRWIIFIPVSVICYTLFFFLVRISYGYIGYDLDSPIGIALQQFSSIAGFLFGCFFCVPKYNYIITGVFSVIWGFISLFALYSQYISGNLISYTSLTDLILAAISIVAAVYLFIEHGKNFLLMNSELFIDADNHINNPPLMP
jgi:hypothetical protein